MTYAILAVSLILFTLLMIATSHLVAPVQASEPTLTDCLNHENFTYTGPVSTETFPAGTYNITMYAEWAGYYYQNQLYWYPVSGDISNSTLIFTGPQGAQGGMGYVDPPITESFTSSSQFGLSFKSPDSQSPFYTQTSRNLDGTQHAKIYQSTTASNLYFIGFENMGALSGSDFDYNDMVISIRQLAPLIPPLTVGGYSYSVRAVESLQPLTLYLPFVAVSAVVMTATSRIRKRSKK